MPQRVSRPFANLFYVLHLSTGIKNSRGTPILELGASIIYYVLTLTKNFFPLRLDLVLVSRIDRMYLGKLIAPGKRPARVEYRPRVGEIAGDALFRRKPRVDRAAPAIVGDLDAGLWIAAGAHGPHDVGHVRGIDIIVHEHDEAAEVAAFARTEGDVRRLPGMSAAVLICGEAIIFMTMRLRLPATPMIVLRCALAWMIAGPPPMPKAISPASID